MGSVSVGILFGLLAASLLIQCYANITGPNSMERNWSKSDFRLSNQSSTGVVISWEPTFNKNGAATKLEITAIPHNRTSSKRNEKRQNSSGVIWFNSLKPFTKYNFVVRQKGCNTTLAEIGPIRTWPAAPNKPRTSWKAVTYHEIELRWSKPKPANGKLKKYNIYCRNINNNHSVSIRTKRRFVLVTHLKPATLYKCTLQASNRPHAQQNPKECITSVDVEPIQTLNLNLPSVIIYSVDCNSVNVTTPKVDIKGGKFHGFDLSVQKVGVNASMPWVRRVSLAGEAQSYMVNGLESNTQYSFRMCGKIYPGGHNICSAPHSAVTLSGE